MKNQKFAQKLWLRVSEQSSSHRKTKKKLFLKLSEKTNQWKSTIIFSNHFNQHSRSINENFSFFSSCRLQQFETTCCVVVQHNRNQLFSFVCVCPETRIEFPLKIHLLLRFELVSAFASLRLYFLCCYTIRLSLLNIFSNEADVFFCWRKKKVQDSQVHLFLKEENRILLDHEEYFVEFCEKSLTNRQTIWEKFKTLERKNKFPKKRQKLWSSVKIFCFKW